ncbi:MAG: DsbA family protein [bacterium]|nr:DsbA family protein [bacterium]
MENNNNNEAEKGGTNENKFMVPAAIIISGLIIAGAVVYVSGPKSLQPANNNGGDLQPTPAVNTAEILKVRNGDFYLGNPGAKVVVVEYGDYQCPFCGKWFKEVEPQIINNYVKTGKAVFIFRDFAFLGEESIRSSEATRCANEQGKFWEYHNYLYGNQQGENQGAFSDENLKKIAATLKLNTAAFNTCFDSGKHKQAVIDATAEGRSAGVQGTPATFINGILVSGAQPWTAFQSKIEAELKK